MRTYFEPEDIENYEAAKDLLIRRCEAWAAELRTSVEPFAPAAALDFRHQSIDGRLGYWTAALAEEFLLSYAPRTLSIEARDAAGLPDSLRLLIEYLHETGLVDPHLMIADNEITPDELDAEEGLRGMAEQFIHLMEAAGPEAVTGILADLPAPQARDIVAALRDSGHPGDISLAELVAVTEAHIAERRPGRATRTALKRKPSSRAKRGKRR